MAKEKRVKVENKPLEDIQIGVNYGSVIVSLIKAYPVKGLTIGDMREMTKEIDELEKACDGTDIEVSEKFFNHAMEVLPLLPFKVYSKELIEMDDYFNSLITKE